MFNEGKVKKEKLRDVITYFRNWRGRQHNEYLIGEFFSNIQKNANLYFEDSDSIKLNEFIVSCKKIIA